MKNRRDFVKSLAATAFLGAAGKIYAKDNNLTGLTDVGNKISYPSKAGLDPNRIERILPPGLKAGDTIAIASPASPVSSWNVREAVRTLEKLGYKVELGEIIKKQKNDNRYLADSDQERTDELMGFFARQDIAAIMTGRGGYGVMRILNNLDYNIIKANPKIVMGFSDITALLLAIYNKTGIVPFHGPVASTSFDTFTTQNMNAVIAHNAFKMEYKIPIPELTTINEGFAEGLLQGGNLRMISSTMGTDYEIDTTNAILYLEDVSEHAYEIDRMLTQLLISRKLETCKAVIFGKFKNLNTRKSFYPNRAMTIREVITELFKPLNIPVAYDFPFGHTGSKVTLPLGVMSSIDTKSKTFKILEPAVS